VKEIRARKNITGIDLPEIQRKDDNERMKDADLLLVES
jgi:hypothetical protein